MRFILGKNWCQRFLERHNNIRKKYVTKLSKAGAKVTEQQLRKWFLEVEETLAEENVDMSIFNQPQRILNLDESGFQLTPNEYKALCGQNVQNVYSVINNSDKESYTVLFGCTAAGDLTPPMILYAGQRISKEIAESIPAGWTVGVSDEGWQTTKTFYEYVVNDLYKWLVERGTEFPVVIFVDGHKSHVSMELAEFCVKHRLILISLYPNSTRILQPLDKLYFGPLKKIWFKVLRQHLLADNNARVTKTNFGRLVKTAVDNFTNSKDCLKKAFKVCGLSPWNVNEIDFSELPANATQPENLTSDDTLPYEPLTNAHLVQLEQVELGLQQAQLARFTTNRDKDFWYGPLEELALFNFWKSIKDKSEGLMYTEPLILFQSLAVDLMIDNGGECVIQPLEHIGNHSCKYNTIHNSTARKKR